MDAPPPIPADIDLATWLQPRAALNLVQAKVPDLHGAISWIVERLRADRIMAAAMNARIAGRDHVRVWMTAATWEHWAYLAPGVMDFWNGGDVTLWGHGGNTMLGRFFDVRFEPAAFGLNVSPSPPPIAVSSTDSRKPLPLAEYANASRAIVEGWGTTITEDRAVQMAKALFPDHQVGRDPFLAQYRVIRGPKKRGKPPLRGK